ncbi:hypothetical protein, partial [Pseudovibrio sp. WM33]|uniref:hypothetical protein n=1 Tax=Pseudovibrio sp. WM33 TaxID=1735585 RepID=UPI000AA9A8A8
ECKSGALPAELRPLYAGLKGHFKEVSTPALASANLAYFASAKAEPVGSSRFAPIELQQFQFY